jgi:hypothetical protein
MWFPATEYKRQQTERIHVVTKQTYEWRVRQSVETRIGSALPTKVGTHY